MAAPRILFIVNPTAGAGRSAERWETLARGLRGDGIHGETRLTTQPGDTTRIAQETAHRFDRIVAVGGDGTAAEVAGGILAAGASSTALGIVPVGTANDCAFALGIRSIDDARRALTQGRTHRIDVIEMALGHGSEPAIRYALGFAAVGIVGEVARCTTPAVKRLFGRRLAYPVGVVRALSRFVPPVMQVRCDGQLVADRFLFVGVSNAEASGGGMKIAPGARMDDGLLNVNLIEAVGRLTALRQMRRLSRGQHVDHPRVRYLAASTVAIDTDAPLEVMADGDVVGQTPVKLRVLPQALSVVVP